MLVREFRKKYNYTQKQMADYLNVSLSTIRSWEQGIRKTPEIYNLYLRNTLRGKRELQTTNSKDKQTKKD